MGLVAIYPKPNLSKACSISQKYPYLLKNLNIIRPNQVWATDITYIKLAHGWAYLIAIIDWHSRYVLSWRLSKTLELPFCLEALNEALKTYGIPEYFNTDQGGHFTALDWIAILKKNGIKISMDGRGRFWDNIFTERLWRSVKCEDVYIRDYTNFDAANAGLKEYFAFYNTIRPHQSLNNLAPAEVHFASGEEEKRVHRIAQDERREPETTQSSSKTADEKNAKFAPGKQHFLFTELIQNVGEKIPQIPTLAPFKILS